MGQKTQERRAHIFEPDAGRAPVMGAAEFAHRMQREYAGAEDFIFPIDSITAAPCKLAFGKSANNDNDLVKFNLVRKGSYFKADDFMADPQVLFQVRNEGKKIVLALRAGMTDEPLEPESLAIQGAQDLGTWLQSSWLQAGGAPGHISVKIKNVMQAAKVCDFLKEHLDERDMHSRVFTLYKGALLPYEHFDLRDNHSRIADVYNQLNALRDEKIYAIGFPRLLNFPIARTSQSNKGHKAINMGRHPLETEDGSLLQNIMGMPKSRSNPKARREVLETLSGIDYSPLVLAAPHITDTKNFRPSKWRGLAWAIRSIPQQLQTEALELEPASKPTHWTDCYG